MWSNGINIDIFSKKLQKIALRMGALPQTPVASGGPGLGPQTPDCDAFEFSLHALK